MTFNRVFLGSLVSFLFVFVPLEVNAQQQKTYTPKISGDVDLLSLEVIEYVGNAGEPPKGIKVELKNKSEKYIRLNIRESKFFLDGNINKLGAGYALGINNIAIRYLNPNGVPFGQGVTSQSIILFSNDIAAYVHENWVLVPPNMKEPFSFALCFETFDYNSGTYPPTNNIQDHELRVEFIPVE